MGVTDPVFTKRIKPFWYLSSKTCVLTMSFVLAPFCYNFALSMSLMDIFFHITLVKNNAFTSSILGLFKIYLQMATVMRFGTTMQIPRRLSHHVPRVPILETDNYAEKTPWRCAVSNTLS